MGPLFLSPILEGKKCRGGGGGMEKKKKKKKKKSEREKKVPVMGLNRSGSFHLVDLVYLGLFAYKT